MSGETRSRWSASVLVVVLCAALGFSAVYAIVGFNDNSATTENSGPAVKSLPSGSEPPSIAASTDNVSSTSASSLTAADGRPLNRGAMTTFVFKSHRTKVGEAVKFANGAGQLIDLSSFKGKVVLLNLWATWCAPCRKEMPDLNALQRDMAGNKFEVVALSVDRSNSEGVRKFLAEVGATDLRFYHDPSGQAGFSFNAIGMPTTILLDRDGREIGRLVGPADWHSPDAKALIIAAIETG